MAKVSQVSLFFALVSSIALKMEPDKSLETLGVLLIFTVALPLVIALLFLGDIDFGQVLQVSKIKRSIRKVFECTLGRWIDGCLQRAVPGSPPSRSSIRQSMHQKVHPKRANKTRLTASPVSESESSSQRAASVKAVEDTVEPTGERKRGGTLLRRAWPGTIAGSSVGPRSLGVRPQSGSALAVGVDTCEADSRTSLGQYLWWIFSSSAGQGRGKPLLRLPLRATVGFPRVGPAAAKSLLSKVGGLTGRLQGANEQSATAGAVDSESKRQIAPRRAPRIAPCIALRIPWRQSRVKAPDGGRVVAEEGAVDPHSTPVAHTLWGLEKAGAGGGADARAGAGTSAGTSVEPRSLGVRPQSGASALAVEVDTREADDLQEMIPQLHAAALGAQPNASLDDSETAHRVESTSLGRFLSSRVLSTALQKQRAAVVERSSNFRGNSCTERVGGVERFVTQSPHQRRHPNQTPSPGMVRAQRRLCAGRVRTVTSPPSPPSLLPGMMRAQPRRTGDDASSSEVQSRLDRAPPLDASGAAPRGSGASGAGASGAAASGRLLSSKYARARLVGAATIRSRGLHSTP